MSWDRVSVTIVNFKTPGKQKRRLILYYVLLLILSV